MDTRRFVLDGTNIALLHGKAQPEFRYVLALCNYLASRRETHICFFDANMGHVLQEHRPDQFEVFQTVLSDPAWTERLHVVPSGMEADGLILETAKAEGAMVISNDRFRDRARHHRWIWKRRHGLVATGQRLTLETLNAEIHVLPAARDYMPDYGQREVRNDR